MWLATISLGSGSSNEPRFIIVYWDSRWDSCQKRCT